MTTARGGCHFRITADAPLPDAARNTIEYGVPGFWICLSRLRRLPHATLARIAA